MTDARRPRSPMTPEQIIKKKAYDRERYLRRRQERDASRPADPISLLSDTAVAYLAGLTDGDGSIFVTHTNRLRTYYPAVCWAMTDHPTIKWVAETLAARTVQHQTREQADARSLAWGKSAFKVQYRTSVAGSRAQLLCRRMLPYLRTKRAQALIVIDFPVDERRAPGVQLSEDVRALREQMGRAISALNRA